MFTLTKKTGYGLIALTHMAGLQDGQLVSAREVAEIYNVPTCLLMNVLKELAAAGVLESVRGARGGYRLAVAAEEITLASLVEHLEGPVALVDCVREGAADDTCRSRGRCPVAAPLEQINDRLHDFLSQVTLTSLMESAGEPAEVGES
ncbi:MAG: RrF2 family transcriptional regulator [Planctomycetota bacterium]